MPVFSESNHFYQLFLSNPGKTFIENVVCHFLQFKENFMELSKNKDSPETDFLTNSNNLSKKLYQSLSLLLPLFRMFIWLVIFRQARRAFVVFVFKDVVTIRYDFAF